MGDFTKVANALGHERFTLVIGASGSTVHFDDGVRVGPEKELHDLIEVALTLDSTRRRQRLLSEAREARFYADHLWRMDKKERSQREHERASALEAEAAKLEDRKVP